MWQIHSWDQNHLHQLKGNSFWAVKASLNCSWTWRKYLGFRPIIWEWIIHAIGDWKNHLSVMGLKAPDDPLMEKYNGRVMFENGIPWNAKAVAVINNNYWHWPKARSEELVSIQSAFCGKPFPNEKRKDSLSWNLTPNGKFSFKSA